MFTVTLKRPDRIDIELSGKIDSDAMRVALDDLINKAAGIEHGRMLYRITDFSLPTLSAIGVEMSRIPALFRMIRKFDRAAVLAEQSWLRKASEIEGALIPGLEIRAFSLTDEAAAEAWLDS